MYPTKMILPYPFARSIRSSISRTVRHAGFSSITCFCASIAARTKGPWVSSEDRTKTTSMSANAISASAESKPTAPGFCDRHRSISFLERSKTPATFQWSRWSRSTGR